MSDVSVEPPPKQGCEEEVVDVYTLQCIVSVEPPPKQGCEDELPLPGELQGSGLSGTPAEAGVREGL